MRLTLRVLDALPRATVVLLLIGVLVGGGLAYGLFVVQQRQYLEGRNYRLLTALASQIEGAIDSEARVFESLTRAVETRPAPKPSSGPTPSGQPGAPAAAIAADALERPRRTGSSAADLRPWMYVKRRFAAGGVLPEVPPVLCDPKATYHLAGDEPIRLEIGLSSNPPPASKDSAPRRSSCRPEGVTLKLPLKPILEPIFSPKLAQRVFDTIALVTQDGSTAFVVGRRATELRSVPLNTLLQPGPRTETKASEKKEGSAPPVPGLVHTAVNDATIGGVPYKLFTQPCCRYAGNAGPVMIVGLVEANAIKSQSWALSTTFVKVVVIVILLALVAWPFLKLTLLGERQRVRAIDVFLIAASSVAALALITVVGLDMSAYSRLNDDRDLQLAALARKLKENAGQEIRSALAQLHCLTQVRAQERTTPNMLVRNITYDEQSSSCTGNLRELPAKSQYEQDALPSGRWPYPFFDSFTLVDDTGMQTLRLSTTAWTQSLLSVDTRRYFKDIKEERGWHDNDRCKEGCAFEAVWSWRSGEQQAVLSVKAPEHSGAAVAALAIPMRSLIRPVLPPGFEFAVIDEHGEVLFHSDRHRNGFENFFRETELNRRLRAQVVAHSAEPLDLRYWGAPYRAHVEPLGMFDLSVITLFQKEQAWALNREWLVVTLLFLAVYQMLWVIVLLVTLVPDASWVWPDPARRYRYLAAIGVYLLLLVAAVMAARHEQGTALVWWALGLPLAAWGLTFMLWRYRPSPAQEPRVHRPVYAHAVASVLLLVVSGVVPAVLLFLASFQLHVQSYVKHNGFSLAAAIREQDWRLNRDYGKDRGEGRPMVLGLLKKGRLPEEQRQVQKGVWHEELDRYYEFFYGTRIEDAPERTSTPAGCPTDAAGDDDVLLHVLESHLPYYAESSIGWRELLHAHAGDDSWRARIWCDGLLSLTLTKDHTGSRTVTSKIPSLLNAPREDAGRPLTLAALAPTLGSAWPYILLVSAAAVLGLACAMAVFLMRHVFLASVTVPLWSDTARALAKNGAGGGHDPRARSVIGGEAAPPPCAPRTADTARAPGTPQTPRAWRLRLIETWLAREGRAHPLVQRICERIWQSETVQAGRLTRAQVADELADRAAPVYRRCWDACSQDEKLMLAHMAQEGWANASARHVVRALLGRGLLKKDPELRLMNETFGAFVRSRACGVDVQRLESSTDQSTWDQLRMPMSLGVVGASFFLLTTQQELYNTILGITTSAAVSVPALVRAVSMLAGRRTENDETRKA